MFNANNFYDRNALYIDGKLVCPYRDGEQTEQKVTLSEGLHEITVAGYVDARGTVFIRWKPPGQDKLSPVPGSLLFCNTQRATPVAMKKPAAKAETDAEGPDAESSVEIPDGYALLKVKNMTLSPLVAEPAHPCISDALIYSRPKAGNLNNGVVDFEVERDGLVFLMASWEYDGNSSGGWTRNSISYPWLTREWAPLGKCPWDASHSLFFRHCRKGEAFSIRTRKYNAPQPILAKPVDLTTEPFASHVPVEAQDTILQIRFQRLLKEKNFTELQTLAEQFRKDKSVLPSGATSLKLLYSAIGSVKPVNLRSLTERNELLQEWVAQHPDSDVAKIAMANSHATLGGFARGGRVAADVTDAQLGAYQEGNELAMEILEPLLDSGTRDPELYAACISSSRALGAEPDDVREWVSEAFRLYPGYERTIVEAAAFFLPRWHGTSGDLVRLAELLAELDPKQGDAAYARVVIAVFEYAMATTFQEDSFDLPRLKRGLELLQKEFPRARKLRNEVCFLACLALDREQAQESFAAIGDNPDFSVWRNGQIYRLWRKIFSPETVQGEQQSLFMPHYAGTRQAIYSPDGTHIITSGIDGLVRVWNLETGNKVAENRIDGGAARLCNVRDNVVLLGTDRGVIAIWDWKADASQVVFQMPGRISSLDFRLDNQSLLAATREGAMIVIELKTRKTIFHSRGGMHSGNLVARFSPDGKSFLTTGGDGRVSVYSVAVGQEETAIPSDGAPKTAIAMSPDGSLVAAGRRDGIVSVWDLETGKLIGSTQKTGVDVTDLEFSPDGQLLGAAHGSSRYAEVGNSAVIRVQGDGLRSRRMTGHSMAVVSLEFSKDGAELLTGSADWTVRRFAVQELLEKE